MNRTLILAGTLLALTACSGGGSTTTTNQESKEKQDSVYSKPQVRRQLVQKNNFELIVNMGSVDIVYNEGPYNIEATGTEEALDKLHLEYDSNCLTIMMQGEDNKEIHHFGNGSTVTLYITAPRLIALSVCGSGSFRADGTIHTSDIQFGGLGMGNIETDSIVCNSFSYELSNMTNATFAHVSAEDHISINAHGKGATKASFSTPGYMSAMINADGKLDMDGNADESVEISSLGPGHGTFNVSTNLVAVRANGNSHLTLKGTTKDTDIRKAPTAVVEDLLEKKTN